MDIEKFILFGVLLLVPCMYGISMFWYFLISRNKGIYLVEVLVFIASLVTIIVLGSIAYSADIGDALAAIFGTLFLIPILISTLVAAVLVKLTITFIGKDK